MKLILFLVAMLLFSASSQAHEVKTIDKNITITTKTQKHEVKLFFDDLMQHYNDYLSDTNNTSALKDMADAYHLPAFQVIPGIPLRVLNSSDNLASNTQTFLNRLITEGVSSVEWEKVHIEMLTDKTAYASNVGVRHLKSGEVFNKVAADYIIFKTNGSWKIAVLVLHSPHPFKNQQIEQEVRSFFTSYLNNYNDILSFDGDNITSMDATGEHLNTPAINISQLGDFLLFKSKQQVVTNTNKFLSTLKSQGAARVNYDKIQIKLLTEYTAIASNIASINKSDGTVMLKIGATYIVNKTPDGWKIVFRTSHAPESILQIK